MMINRTTSNWSEADIKKYFKEKNYQKGELIVSQFELASGIYFIIKGTSYGSYSESELDREAILNYEFTAGDMLGFNDLNAARQHPYSVYANNNVSLLFLKNETLERLLQDQNAAKIFYEKSFVGVSKRLRESDKSMINDALINSDVPEVDFLVESAVQAQKKVVNLSEEKIDNVINEVALAINAHAQELASLTVQESQMGIAEHKVLKIGLGTVAVAKTLVGQVGVKSAAKVKNGVETFYSPMGVIFGMIPITNPVETIVFKFLSALKSRNAIIVSSHRKGRHVGLKTVQLIQEVLKEQGLPVSLIQAPQLEPSRAVTNAFMRHKNINFILATGGPSMVKSAYQSGTPAIGVGKGNAPVWVTAGCDLNLAAQSIIESKAFDNGIVCGSENNLLVDKTVLPNFIEKCKSHGAVLLNTQESQLLEQALFASGRLDGQWVGKSAADICEFVGIKREYAIKLILQSVPSAQLNSPFLKEKLAPILSLVSIDSNKRALSLAKSILSDEGAGHTAIIHSQDKQLIDVYSQAVDVSRVLVNTPGTQGCIGAANNLKLSWTLGCGTQGGGSTSDNVTYRNLMNKKRVAHG